MRRTSRYLARAAVVAAIGGLLAVTATAGSGAAFADGGDIKVEIDRGQLLSAVLPGDGGSDSAGCTLSNPYAGVGDLRDSWHVDVRDYGEIDYEWNVTSWARPGGSGCQVRATLQIQDGSFRIPTFDRDDVWWHNSPAPTATASYGVSLGDSLRVPYYNTAGVRQFSSVLVVYKAEYLTAAGFTQYACTTTKYEVMATPTGPRFEKEPETTPGCVFM